MYGTYAALTLLGCALLWTALNKSGVSAFDWYISLIIIGLASVAFWLRPRRRLAASFPNWLRISIASLGGYLIFQAIPLPLGLLGFFSPQKAEMVRALGPVMGQVGFSPIALNPANHVLWTLNLFGCAAVFFLIRDLTYRLQGQLFLAFLPLLAVAGFEAVLGLLQVAAGAPQAVGSYNGRDHYCCILEITLPLSIAFGLVFWLRRTTDPTVWPLLQAIGCWLISCTITLGILFSLSRAGWVDSLVALILLACLLLLPRVPSRALRLGILIPLCLTGGLVFIYASPEAMLNRLVSSLTTDSEGRLQIWSELPPLLHQYRWFGTGLLGFDPAFLQFQNFANNLRIDFAHNDFLQYLIELGLFGFVPLLFSLAAIVKPILEDTWPFSPHSDAAERRLLSIGCIAGLLALCIHSTVDFNMYIPANVLAFCWILGFGSAVVAAAPRRRHEVPQDHNQERFSTLPR